MVTNLESFRPSSLLTDMLAELRDAAAKLDAFTPSAVLAPITAPLAQVKRFVDETLSLDPVFAQLNAALDRLTALLAKVDVAPFLDELESALADVRTRLESMLTTDGILDGLRPIHQAVMSALAALDPSTLLAPIQNAKQTLVTAVDAVDVSALSGAFDALAHEIDSFGLDPIRARFHDRAQQLVSALSAFDLAGKVTQLQTLQHAIHEALDSRGVLPDAVAEDRRQSMLATVDALDPVAVLAPAVTAFRKAQTDAAALAAALDTSLASGTALQTQLTALVAKLRDMALGVEAGTDPKQTLHHAIDTAFGELGLDEITALYSQVHDTFDSYSPEHLQGQLDALLAPVHELITGLTDPHELFAEVETAFNDVKGIVDPGLRDFVTQLRGDVEPILDAVKAKVDAVDLGAVSSELDARYAEITQLKNRLLDKLQSLVDGLDAPYREVVQIVEDLNPATVLVQPLEETFNAIMAKLGVIDVRKVFQPLLDAIGALRDKLLAQIDRVEQAFEEFLGAAPSGGGARWRWRPDAQGLRLRRRRRYRGARTGRRRGHRRDRRVRRPAARPRDRRAGAGASGRGLHRRHRRHARHHLAAECRDRHARGRSTCAACRMGAGSLRCVEAVLARPVSRAAARRVGRGGDRGRRRDHRTDDGERCPGADDDDGGERGARPAERAMGRTPRAALHDRAAARGRAGAGAGQRADTPREGRRR